MEKKRLSNFCHDFHRIGPLGRFGLVVAMSVRLFVCLSPSHAIFCVCGLGMRPSSMDWCMCQSPLRGALKTGRCSELDRF